MTALLALEASTRAGSVALLTGASERVAIDERELAGARAHASDLLPEADRLLAARGLALTDLDAIVVGLGPGSYTGLRVACATALGLARGAGLALVGVPSFEAAALAALSAGEEAMVVVDARAGAFYHARYARDEGDALRVVAAPAVTPAAALRDALVAGAILIASEATLDALELTGDPRARDFAPRAGALARRGAARLASDGPSARESIEPLYLRAFAAKRRSS